MRHIFAPLLPCSPAPLLLLLPLVAFADTAPTITLRPPKADAPAVFEVSGLDAKALAALKAANPSADGWSAVFSVVVADGDPKAVADRPPLLGTHSVADGVIRFEPRFPVAAGVTYRATFHPAKLPGGDPNAKPVTADLSIPKPKPNPTTLVEQVYPTADVLPENHLKFYLHFSAPMSRGDAERYVRLLGPGGKEIPHPFLAANEELWDAAGTRLTLFLDPSRVKRELKPREEAGPILEAGKKYALVIDPAWQDANGHPLKAGFRKAFAAGPPDEVPPDHANWKLAPPAAGKADPLRVTFPEPLDHALLHRMVWVVDAAGHKVDGTVTVGDKETAWAFAPKAAWKPGKYKLVADTRLEDRAGNQIGKPFEVDEFGPITKEIRAKTVEREFDVK
jgi:hypothetical protein